MYVPFGTVKFSIEVSNGRKEAKKKENEFTIN